MIRFNSLDRFCIALPMALAMPLWAMASTGPLMHHDMRVLLQPEQGRIQVEDSVRVPEAWPEEALCFSLHAGLEPRLEESNLVLGRAGSDPDEAGAERFCLRKFSGKRRFTVRYGGAAPISARGVYLDAGSRWYPQFGGERFGFRMTVRLPDGWRSVTQGERRSGEAVDGERLEIWEEEHPQEEIYLVAAPFHEYSADAGPVRTMVFLRRPDADLARRYLDAAGPYIEFYSRLIGPYPYRKFAVVENVWQSGYGMPSFTLLGSRVIRLPFIVHTAYPHEILHNWWGNGVYPDYASGNWSEGLTAYLADHRLEEAQGEGAEFRRIALQRYTDYVGERRDFPLNEFRARHDSASQAIGYDKALMFFHMLRLQLGDAAFIDGLRRFYAEHLFQRAGFSDLQAVFEAVGGESLEAEFGQWLDRAGAPSLEVTGVRARPTEDGYQLLFTLKQAQPRPAYQLRIPVAVQLAGQDGAWRSAVAMAGKRMQVEIALPARPWRLYVDPEFDLMRRLDYRESPPSLSRIFGSERILIVLPAKASRPIRARYRALAQQWSSGAAAQIAWDIDLEKLPADRGVWLFGWENRFGSQLAASLNGQPLVMTGQTVTIEEQTFGRDRNGVVLVGRHPENPEHALAWLANDQPQALPVMAGKLRHYGSYSYLVFAGNGAGNVLKGRWRNTDSPLILKVEQADGAQVPSQGIRFAPRPVLGGS